MFKKNQLIKIKDCMFYVVKQYALKIFIYPFILTFGYDALKYIIKNDVELTYNIAFYYVAIIFIPLMAIAFINKYMTYGDNKYIYYGYSRNTAKVYHEKIKFDEETIRIRAYHEAGHFFIAKMLELPLKEVNIISNEKVGGQVILDMPDILKASQIRNIVMVKYAGFITEKILNGEASDGCMGCDSSDMESAIIFLRKYILLTDDSISFTGLEDEYIKTKSIELSKLWKKEVETLLRENENTVKEIADELIEKRVIKEA